MSKLLVLEPLDTLFFRDNRPFSAGEDVYAESVFPSPLTLFGAIGSYILNKNGTDLIQFFNGQIKDPVLGDYDESLANSKLKIKGPFLIRKDKLYFHPPANLFCVDSKLKPLWPDLNAKPEWDISAPLKPITIPKGDYKPMGCLLSEEEVLKYLHNRIIPIREVSEEEIFLKERRYGHKLSRETMAVEEGFLYSTEHLRFKEDLAGKVYEKSGLAIFVDLDDFSFSEELIFAGGERKMTILKESDKSLSFPEEEIMTEVARTGRFFLYFVTPAIFSGGFVRKDWPDEFKNIGAEPVGAAVNKPIYISGWKRKGWSSGHPRPLRKAVPAGSVYFFTCDRSVNDFEKKFEDLYSKYNFNESLSEEYPCAGFGIAFIGIW